MIAILVILVFSRLCAWVLKRLGQPQVIGEMIAGIILGKSVFAVVWPEGFAFVFPSNVMPLLNLLSQIGLLFFIFAIGLGLDVADLKGRKSSVILISKMSILVPFALGAALGFSMYEGWGPPQFTAAAFALFMGIAMSITAFPVLARIIQEKGIHETSLGTLALTCAAVNDVVAWYILAAVVGIAQAGSALKAVEILAASMIYIGLMWKLVKPIVEKLLQPKTPDGKLTYLQLAVVLATMAGSALIAELVGIHALFGAFFAGALMPKAASLRAGPIGKIEKYVAIFLLPIFFAHTGIRLQIGLIDSWDMWLMSAGIIVLAMIGKVAGAGGAARWTGMKWRESLAIGVLLNTRGLMELVVLNIGYDIGILSPRIFTIMVIMALATTVITGPLLSMVLPDLRRQFTSPRN